MRRELLCKFETRVLSASPVRILAEWKVCVNGMEIFSTHANRFTQVAIILATIIA